MRSGTPALVGAALAAVALWPRPSVRAQSIAPQCEADTPLHLAAQDVCHKALDLFQFVAPQVGLAVGGGNATLGQGGAIGGLGHFALGLRANGMNGVLPDVRQDVPSASGARSTAYPVTRSIVGYPALDVAVGVFRGLPLTFTKSLAVDALVNIAYLPRRNRGGVSLRPTRGNVDLGFGARVGLVQESIVTPGVAVTYLRRSVPTFDIDGRAGNATLAARGARIRTDAWRVTAGKSVTFAQVAAGAGRDRYDARADAEYQLDAPGVGAVRGGPVHARQTLSRINVFVDIAANFPFFKVVGEVGRAWGGRIETFNTFSGSRADRPLVYGSVGVRAGL